MKTNWQTKKIMTGRQKISQVLEHIMQESEISPDHNLIRFKFNNIVSPETLYVDEEKIILKKLEKEGVIKIRNNEDYYEVSIKIEPLFYKKYFLYRLTSLDKNAWNILNPFWILLQLIVGIYFFMEWLWNKNKIILIVFGTMVTYLAIDYSQAWKNLNLILIFLKLK